MNRQDIHVTGNSEAADEEHHNKNSMVFLANRGSHEKTIMVKRRYTTVRVILLHMFCSQRLNDIANLTEMQVTNFISASAQNPRIFSYLYHQVKTQ